MVPAASTPTRPQHAGKDKKTNAHTPSTRKNLKGVMKKVTGKQLLAISHDSAGANCKDANSLKVLSK